MPNHAKCTKFPGKQTHILDKISKYFSETKSDYLSIAELTRFTFLAQIEASRLRISPL